MRLPISQVIKRLRKEKDITQEELASVLGVTYQSVSRWENDIAYPDVELIPIIASYFCVTTDVLFGTDEATIEFKRQEYLKAIKEQESIYSNEDFKKLERILKNAIKDFPTDVFFQWKLCSLYHRMGLECAKKNIEAMRKYASFVIENDKTIKGNYRIGCIRVMIRVEDEDKLENWTKYVSDSFYTSLPSIIASRFKYRNEVESYNKQIQRNLRNTLTDTFLRDFSKMGEDGKKDGKARVEGQKIILSIIDTLRDSSIELDAWLKDRAFTYFRLALGYFEIVQNEEAYKALEKSLDLYEMLFNLPDDIQLKYNSSVLNLLTWTKAEYNESNEKRELLVWINDLNERFSYKNEEKLLKSIERAKRITGINQ